MTNEKNPNKNSSELCNLNSWIHNNNGIWLGSTIKLIRNLEKFKFPSKLATDKRKQIIALMAKDLLADEDLVKPKIFKSEDVSPLDKEFLMEHFLEAQDFHQAQSGEAFVLDGSGEFLATLNLNDHLVLQSIDARDELEKAWAKLVKIEAHLNKTVSFAFSPRFGFLTSDPTQCGTGLVVFVFLHLPALNYNGQLEKLIKNYQGEGIAQAGLQGDPEEIIGDIYAFHNHYTLGLSEENILGSIRTLTTKVLVEEKSARSHLRQESNSFIKDKVSRAYGILLHSYQIEAVEALNALSMLKLGLDLEWIGGTSHADLNQLLFDCRRAHLLCHYGKRVQQEEIPHRRAEFIHQALKNVTLLI